MISRRSFVASLAAASAAPRLLPAQQLVRNRKLGAEGGLTVILLGTGTPLPNSSRASASTLVIAGARAFLVDTGRGCLTRLAEAGLAGVDAILYTHFHSDHCAELGELMVDRAINGAESPMPVYGPPGAARFTAALLSAYELDGKYRKAHHGEKWREAAMQTQVVEKTEGVVLEDGGLKIAAFEVDHAPAAPAVGYRFDFEGKSAVISGDTRKTPRMTEMARGADLLVHEAINAAMIRGGMGMMTNNPRMQAMAAEMMDYHTTTLEAAEIARDAGVKKLALTHLVPGIPPTELAENNFIRGMAEIYSGPIVVGRDGMEIAV